MKTFSKGQVSCDNCWLAIHAPNGGYICMEQIGKSLFEMPGCPGAITDEIVRKSQSAALKSRPAPAPEQLFKTKAEVEALHEMEKTYFAGFESGVRYASEKADREEAKKEMVKAARFRADEIRHLLRGVPPLAPVYDHLKQEQLAKTKAELDQLLSEAKLLVMQLKSAKLRLEDDPPLAKDIGDIGDKLAENRKKLIDRQSAPIAAAGEREQPLGTAAEPAGPPPASELPPKTGKAKIKVKIAMNIDLIAEYFSLVSDLQAKSLEIEEFPSRFEQQVVELKKSRKAAIGQRRDIGAKISALEAEIMEKLMAK